MRTALVCLMAFFVSCNDSEKSLENDVNANASDLIGNWQLEATKISPGGIVDWTLVEDGGIYSFEANGTFSYTNSKNPEHNRLGTYTLDENELSFTYTRDGQQITGVYNRVFTDGKLILQFIGCIEECSERYKRVN
ncbi:lipocalin family protein [Spongiimicrobium sp. 3-5]|uniref:lipocalin family protein n=1 Tax=Spongiimicrobium sp. 3-5 TaxID=3332596 RepID=UPI00397EA9B5